MNGTATHTPFVPPADVDVSIWRYIDFARFVSMLETESLWFARIDQLGDPYEGSTPWAEKEFWQRRRAEQPETREIANHNETFFRGMARHSRASTFVNCWHMNEHESEAMWQLYSRDSAGLAIRSTFARLREALPEGVDLGVVNYIDYDTEMVPPNNIINYCMYKRRSFEHERELRALIWGLGIDSATKQYRWPIQVGATGLAVTADLTRLVHSVVLAPFGPPWVEALVRAVLDKYALKTEIQRSAMERVPLL